MTPPERQIPSGNASPPLEAVIQALTRSELLVRWVLMTGFLAVLTTEAWLLWRAWQNLF